MDRLEGKTAVITGAASGMGRAMCLRFAQAGMNIVLADVDDTRMAVVADEVRAIGPRAVAVHTDVAESAAHTRLLDATIDAFGQANIVCLNAGVTGKVGRSWTLTEQDWRWSLGILLDGVIFGIGAFVPHLIEHGDGHVVTTASIAGHIGSPYSGPYAVAKHGVVTLSETLYHELVADGSTIGVTCLCPGFVNTNIVAAAREVGATKDEKGDRWIDRSERALSGGLDPELVGHMVHDAVLAKQFWLFTDTMWDTPIRTRTDEIIGRVNPTLAMPGRG